MDTPLIWQGLYTAMLAGSAAVIAYAALVAMKQLYPSLKLFYGQGAEKLPDEVPYGSVMAVVVLGFAFAAYVTPATVMAGLAVMVLCGYAAVKPLPPMALQLIVCVAAALALFADIDVLKQGGFSPQEMGLAAGCVAAPVIASFAPARGAAAQGALAMMALIAATAVVAGPVVTQSFTHGTAVAAVLAAATMVTLFYMQRHAGAVGTGAMVALSMVLAHSALVLGHSGLMLAGLAMMGAVVVATCIAASGQVAR